MGPSWDDGSGRSEKPRMQWLRRHWQTVSLVTATVLIPPAALEVYYRLQPPPTRLQKKAAKQDPFANMKRVRRTRRPQPVAEPREDVDQRRERIRQMREDVLNIAPEIYSSVRVELVTGDTVEGKDGSIGGTSTVRAVYVHVRSRPWDAKNSSSKIQLLHKTYYLLRTRYPTLTRLVSLRFDDSRADLDLKFDDDELNGLK